MKEKIGILYYSLSGHTKKIAEEIKAVTGDLIPISTVKAYPADYEELVEKGQ
jgi:flavodoxin